MTKHEIIANHFGEPIEDFRFVRYEGWYYKRFYLGRSLSSMQKKSTWFPRLLRGRDLEASEHFAGIVEIYRF